MMDRWRKEAFEFASLLCHAEWQRVNTRPNGKPYKRPRPYTHPILAQQLIECLDANDEHRARSLVIWDFR